MSTTYNVTVLRRVTHATTLSIVAEGEQQAIGQALARTMHRGEEVIWEREGPYEYSISEINDDVRCCMCQELFSPSYMLGDACIACCERADCAQCGTTGLVGQFVNGPRGYRICRECAGLEDDTSAPQPNNA